MSDPRQRDLETESINAIRVLAIDAIQAANSGHPGLPLGAAPMAYVLFTEFMKFNPQDPEWPDRDRFVLSAGHGSALLYSLLHLTGYALPIEEVKNFRQLGSMTPGHPERRHTPGVEVTTGPLGQGFANGVGLAVAEAFLAATFNKPGREIVNHYTYGIVSDGDIMEGVAAEAASLAGHLGLGKLIYLYDQNEITLAGSIGVSFSEDVPARFRAVGWHVQEIDGNDVDAVRAAITAAQAETSQPSLICARTTIGFGSPKAGNFGVHGSPLGAEGVAATKAALGYPAEPAFYVSEAVYDHFHESGARGASAQAVWQRDLDGYEADFPEEAATFNDAIAGKLAEDWDSSIPTWEAGAKAVSTRKASGEVINAFAAKVPTFIGGSADLNPSTNTAMKNLGDFEMPGSVPDPSVEQGLTGGDWSYAGRNIHYGIREHAMGSVANGIAAHGGCIPFTATFLVFADYMRPPIRLAALSGLKTIFVFTHDSIAVGEDGPTHEPVEQLLSLRIIPKLVTIRPADANETAAAWKVAMELDGPSVLVFSRQDLPILNQADAVGSVAQGAYILSGAGGSPDVVLIGTGSEVDVAVQAAGVLADHGITARVVSMPSWELFQQQDAEYRASVLGPTGTPRVAVEAGVTTGWERFTGDNGAVVGLDRYGASGPGEKVLKHFGFTAAHVAATALRVLGRDAQASDLDDRLPQ
ncbi:MAG: transketolase [Thermomicrobiales bacterium]